MTGDYVVEGPGFLSVQNDDTWTHGTEAAIADIIRDQAREIVRLTNAYSDVEKAARGLLAWTAGLGGAVRRNRYKLMKALDRHKWIVADRDAQKQDSTP